MSGFDGLAEAEAILARLRTIAGGRIYDGGAPDYEELAKDDGGRVRPYAVVFFGEPIPDKAEATLGPTREQPFMLPVTVQWVASDPGDLRQLAAAGAALLLEWRPTPSAGYMEPMNGGEFTTRDTQDRPTRYNRIAHWPVGLNYSRVEF